MRNLNKPPRYNVASVQARQTLGDVMESDEEGQYVEWRDYRWLLAELTNLKSEADQFKAEVERLRASSFVTAVPAEQYERVVKAGDAMYYWLGVCGRRNNSTGDDWLRAKKGAMLQSEQFELERKNIGWVVYNAKEGKPSV